MKSDKFHQNTYEAFISYRHKPLDSKVAKVIHGLIETFKLPKHLVKQGYPQNFRKVFRDREELPVSSDLSSSIDTALRLSKYIFVICSPNTPLSKWVEQEILTFISLGRCDYIIPVLIDGDIDTSFPEPLRKLYYENSGLFDAKIIDVRSVDTNGVLSNLNSKRTRIISLLLNYDYKKFDEIHHKYLVRKLLKRTLFIIIPCMLFGIVNFAGLYFIEEYSGKVEEKNIIISQINSYFLNEYI
jgi:hypothetical protein